MTGGGFGLIAGGETFGGILTDTSESSGANFYAISSKALTLGVEEDATAFVGLYLSTEQPSEVTVTNFSQKWGPAWSSECPLESSRRYRVVPASCV